MELAGLKIDVKDVLLMTNRLKNILLIWDFDDTIVKTNIEFEKTNKEAAKIIANVIYESEKIIKEILILQRKIDFELIPTYGFVPQRYIDSWMKTYKFYAKKENRPILPSVKNKILNTIQDVYVRKYREIPYAVDTLTRLKEMGYPMVILTAGVDSVQRRRIKEAGIEDLMDNIYVRLNKTPEELREVIDNHSADDYVMIGNSLKTDIYPALENDIWGFHVERRTWSADDYPIDQNHSKYVHLNSITQVPDKLKTINRSFPLSV